MKIIKLIKKCKKKFSFSLIFCLFYRLQKNTRNYYFDLPKVQTRSNFIAKATLKAKNQSVLSTTCHVHA